MDPVGLSDLSNGVRDVSGATAAIALPVVPPFHLEGTVRLLQRHPSNWVDRWDSGRYVRVIPTTDGLRLVTVENLGTIDAPELRCLVLGGPVSTLTHAEVSRTVQRLLGLGVDLEPFYRVAHGSPRLEAATRTLRGLHPPRFPTLFETIVNVVPFQQVSLAAGVAAVGRIVELFGRPLSLGRHVFHAFPQPESFAATDAGELRLLGLSRAKATTLHDLAQRVLSGELREERLEALSTEAAMETLTALPGIGPWSASLVLLRGLQRMEIFPPGDIAATKNLARLQGLDRQATTMSDLQPHIERMGDAKGFLYFYALGWRLLEQGLITPAPGAGH